MNKREKPLIPLKAQPKTPHYWDEAVRALSKKDKKFAKVIASYDSVLQQTSDAFTVLLKAINGQQISIIAAQAIWQRICEVHAPLTPAKIIKLDEQELRSFGYSRQKAQYFKNVAHCFLDNPQLGDLDYSQYQEIYQILIDVKGIGSWTIEMYAIFYLNHPDIFPVKDVGLLRGLEKIYGEPFDSKKAQDFGLRYKPYRTVATWYLWRILDAATIQY